MDLAFLRAPNLTKALPEMVSGLRPRAPVILRIFKTGAAGMNVCACNLLLQVQQKVATRRLSVRRGVDLKGDCVSKAYAKASLAAQFRGGNAVVRNGVEEPRGITCVLQVDKPRRAVGKGRAASERSGFFGSVALRCQ
jgi:hypothetical protein